VKLEDGAPNAGHSPDFAGYTRLAILSMARREPEVDHLPFRLDFKIP